MSTESPTLKNLLQTLTDGIEGFSRAAESVKDADLKILFQSFAAERQEMADELTAFSDADGSEQKATLTGTLHRGWINLKSALTSGEDHSILAECERGEDHALEAFQKAAEADFPTETKSTIASIATRILAVHNQVRQLRDRSTPPRD